MFYDFLLSPWGFFFGKMKWTHGFFGAIDGKAHFWPIFEALETYDLYE